jgi:DNA primase
MRFSREFIDKVISASQLADVISQYTVLKPAGKDLVGRCPFPDHKEKTPSFHVSPDKQVYHCFGCKKGGNVFTFLQQFQGMGFPEAIEYLAQRASIPLPVMDQFSATQEQKEALRRKELLEINRVAAQYFMETYKKLPPGHSVRDYTHKRYLKAETIEMFQIGYANEDWEGLVQHLRLRGLSMSLAEELGLVKRRDSGGYFDLFRDRLMFTITGQMGDVIGFGGRILGEGQPKYINSPESVLFHKGRSLYGLQHTSRYIRSQDEVIIVEGYMDLIALFQAGFKNVVAPLGTALTLEQCRILAKMTKNVIVLFDGDSAGQTAAERSLPILFEAGMYPKGLVLPEGQDPDEFLLAHGEAKMADQLVAAPDLFSLILRRWMEGFQGSSTDKVRMVQKIKPVLAPLKEAALKSLYLREVAQKLGVDSSWMQRAILEQGAGNFQAPLNRNLSSAPVENTIPRAMQTQGASSIEGARENEKINLQGAPKWELLILALALNPKTTLWDRILQAEEKTLLNHAGVRQVFDRASTLTGQSGLPSDNLFVLITNEILNPDLLTALIRELPSGDHEREARLLTDCFRKVRIHDLDLRIKKLAQDLKQDATQEKWAQLASLQKDRLRWLNLNP